MSEATTDRVGAHARERDAEVRPGVSAGEAARAFLVALAFVVATRWPVARTEPFESDEFILVRLVGEHWFNVYHTLFIAAGRLAGVLAGDRYLGFVFLDMLTSALALATAWWWLRALVRPATAAAAALMLGLAPLFWGYGAMAGSYTMIVAVGSFLLGVAARSWRDPKPWHPTAAAAVLAVGTGYRHDIGTLWLPVFLVIVWRHRWAPAARALGLFTALNLAWIALMLREAGGLDGYRSATREFAYQAGYLNSVWNLGLVDAPLRYAVKLAVALCWTFGPALALAPRGLLRLARGADPSGRGLAALLALSVAPALGLHLLVHFGVPGYAFHYAPAVLALVALGVGRAPSAAEASTRPDLAPARLSALGALLAAAFLFYPADFARPGFRGDFDLAFARQTRVGLRTRPPLKNPTAWRTSNSRTATAEPALR
jgi:hypothetical protein